MTELAITIVDAFTDTPFKGNPAGVCIVKDFPAVETMQSIAAELNQAETAFLRETGKNAYHIRWFTPVTEVDLCGHATLASMHVLRERGFISLGESVTFDSLSGPLTAQCDAAGITLDFPAQPGRLLTSTPELEACLGVEILNAEQNATNILVKVRDMDALLDCQPNLAAIKALPAQGLIVTTNSGCAPYDFASRYFAPQVGIPEDPVTGSAHCQLAPYWAKKTDRTIFLARQASARGGDLRLTLQGSRVLIKGHAITTFKGVMTLPAPESAARSAAAENLSLDA